MSDLIDRKIAIQGIRELFHLGECYCDEFSIVGMLNILPSVEPERKKGKWIDGKPYVNSHWWVCSVCHVPAPENHTGYNFCPHCGAEMTR